jgi:CDP-diacylglycerol--serine O-phosphatidyltransferase
MRDLVTLPNALTSAALVAGFLGLLAAVGDDLVQAAGLVTLAAVLDSLDGAVARRGAVDHAFGANLDSLADLVSFGVVPAMALYVGPLHALPVLGLAGCLGFLLAGTWRLARFPLVKHSDHFVGLPIPVAGVLVMLILLWRPSAGLALLLAVTASVLMISTQPFPTFPAACKWAVATVYAPHRRRFSRR